MVLHSNRSNHPFYASEVKDKRLQDYEIILFEREYNRELQHSEEAHKDTMMPFMLNGVSPKNMQNASVWF